VVGGGELERGARDRQLSDEAGEFRHVEQM
jgi:hypothetical protein